MRVRNALQILSVRMYGHHDPLRALRDLLSKKTVPEVADELKVSVLALTRYMKSNGVEDPEKPENPDSVIESGLKRLGFPDLVTFVWDNREKSQAEMADMLGVHAVYFSRRFRKLMDEMKARRPKGEVNDVKS